MNKIPTVADFMSHQVITIGREQSLARARRLMAEHGIRHLPVLHGGVLVGMLSQRDLVAIDALPDVDPERVPVGEALLGETFEVPRDASLRSVVERLARERLGSVVVRDGREVVGVFTTVDAMNVLGDMLA